MISIYTCITTALICLSSIVIIKIFVQDIDHDLKIRILNNEFSITIHDKE